MIVHLIYSITTRLPIGRRFIPRQLLLACGLAHWIQRGSPLVDALYRDSCYWPVVWRIGYNEAPHWSTLYTAIVAIGSWFGALDTTRLTIGGRIPSITPKKYTGQHNMGTTSEGAYPLGLG